MSEECIKLIDDVIAIRNKKGVTQVELAEMSGVTQPAIARLEAKKTVPQLNTLLKVIKALNCNMSVLPNS